MGHRAARRRRVLRHLAGPGRRARVPHPAPRPEGQLLAHGRPRPGRPVLGDLLRQGARARPRGRARGGRGPVPGGMEPGLHAGHAVRGARQGRLRRRGAAAASERRHRHGPGADGVHPAGRGQHLRDRHHLQDPGAGGRAHRAGVRHRPAQRHRAPGRRRPRPVRGHAHRGRGAPLQRGRRLRAAAAAAPLHPQPAPAVRRAARRRRHRVHRLHARADQRHDRRDGGAVPRAAPGRGAHPRCRRHGRGGSSPAPSAPAPRSSTSRSRRPSASTPPR